MPVEPDLPDLPPPSVTEAVVLGAVAAHAAEAHGAHRPVHTHCENCGTPLSGPFCHRCGQHDFEFHRSFRHVFLDALENFFHFDAKLFQNFITLLFQPGKLSADFNAGKRAAQVPPFRLYLFVSVLFFFLVFVGENRPNPLGRSDAPRGALKITPLVDGKPATGAQALPAAPQKAAAKPARKVGRLRPAEEQIRADTAAKNSAEAAAKPKAPKSDFEKWVDHQAMRGMDPASQRQMVDTFLHSLPKMLLFCLPFFALYTRLLFRQSGLVYLQHLVIALHFHTFIYLWIMCRDGWVFLAKLPQLGLDGWVAFACNLWLTLYPLLMLRRVFGNSWKLTVFKTGVLAFAYFLTLGLALMLTAFVIIALL
ncbi:MAG: DUF3667 domain-containing protein [Opitutae bacterium]|nr:DUF3667 domain-containing protein [Opitutae bacterium]